MVGTVAYMPPEQALGGEVDAARRPLLARRDALRAGDRPAAVRRRRPGRDHQPAHQHAAGRAVLARPRLPARARGADPAPAGEGPRERPAIGDRGARGAGGDRRVAEPASSRLRLGSERATRSTASPAASSSGASRSWASCGRLSTARSSGRGPAGDAGRRAGHRQDAHGEELATYARLRGAQVLWGRCYEARARRPTGPGCRRSAPTSTNATPQALRSELGSGAADIAQVVSEVRERLPGLAGAAASMEPEQARFRLFDASPRSCATPSTDQPLVLVLDDLHWADTGSLRAARVPRARAGRGAPAAARHLPRRRAAAPPPARRRRSPSSRASASRARSPARPQPPRTSAVSSRPRAAISPPAEALVAAVVHAQTEGNPLFVTEVVRLLVQEGELNPERLGGTGAAGASASRRACAR